ncbi:OmpA family protein [bacterium]
MKKYYILFTLFFIFKLIFCSTCYADLDYLDEGSLHFECELSFNSFSNRTIHGWTAGSEGINKAFLYNNSADGEWKNTNSSVLSLDLSFKPSQKFNGFLGIDAFGGYTDTFYEPVNDFNRLYNKEQYIRLRQSDITFREDFLKIRYFKGIEHYNWNEEGDIFGLYPMQFETSRYLDISGRAVPVGGEIELDTDFGRLLTIFGEPVWGYRDSLYARYNYSLFSLDHCITYKREEVPWSESDEFKNAVSLVTRFDNIAPMPLDAGILYHPFRIDDSFTYVEETAKGTGDLNSAYIVKQDKTEKQDALGFMIQTYPKELCPWLDDILDDLKLAYTYQGISAGNKSEFLLFAEGHVYDNFWLTGIFTERAPVIGPNPYLFYGTKDNVGPAYVSPRGPESPFWVDNNNRKARIFNCTLTYVQPSLLMNLYKYESGNLEQWNIDTDSNSDLACALGYTLSYYPTTTDTQTYYDESGTIVWEPYNVHGMWETSTPISFIDFVLKSNLKDNLMVLLFMRGGQSLSTGSMSYADTDNYKPSTNMFSADLNLKYLLYTLSLGYGKDVWGTEEWHQRFGITIDNFYQVSIARDFKEWGQVSLKYLTVEQDDYKTLSSIDIGSFEEIQLSWIWKFNSILFFKEPKITKGEEFVEKDEKGPTIKIEALYKMFSPNDDSIGDTILFDMFADDPSGIDKWNLSIFTNDDKNVFKIKGDFMVPKFFEWDGRHLDTNAVVNAGLYYLVLEAADVSGNTSVSKKIFFEVIKPKKISTKEILEKLSAYAAISEDDRGVVLSIPVSVIFKKHKYYILEKSDALDLIYLVLDDHKDYKIRIEAHSDTKGKEKKNKNLCRLRAKNIGEYLAGKGLKYKMLDIIGIGSSRPIAANKTKEGREKNNRIEIIIVR